MEWQLLQRVTQHFCAGVRLHEHLTWQACAAFIFGCIKLLQAVEVVALSDWQFGEATFYGGKQRSCYCQSQVLMP